MKVFYNGIPFVQMSLTVCLSYQSPEKNVYELRA